MSSCPSSRRPSVDLLRAIAIVLMVVVHFAENLSGWYGQSEAFAGVHGIWWLPTGFAAPIFTYLSGVSYRLWAESRRGWGRDAVLKSTVRRGVFLMGLGFVFNVLVWLPEDVFNWDILTLIGFAVLVLAATRWLPDAVLLFAAAAVVAVSPAMRVAAGYVSYWSDGYFDYDFTFGDVVIGWLVTGYFPVFPWLAFPLAGYAMAPRVLRGGWAGPSIGAALVAASFLLVTLWPVMPALIAGGDARAWAMFPATTAYVIGTLGLVIVSLSVAHRLLDEHPDRGTVLMGWAGPLSHHSLSVYLLHHAVHVWPLWAVGLATRGDATALWQVAMPMAWAVCLAIVFLVCTSVLFRWVEKRHVPTAESILRWLCD